MEEIREQPWYRQFWPWFVMAPPAAAVVGGLLTVYLAGTEPSMVVDDYGQIAMATQQRVERERHAQELGLNATIEFIGHGTGSAQPVMVVLTQSNDANAWPDSVRLKLIHPTLAKFDRDILLEGARGQYSGRIERPAGRFYMSLTDEEGIWRLTGELSGNATRHEFSVERNRDQ